MQNNLANKGSKSIQFALHVLIRRGTFMIRFETINNDGRVCGGSLCVFKEVDIQNWKIPLKIQNYIWALYYLLARKAMGKLKHNTTHSGSSVYTNKIAKVRTRQRTKKIQPVSFDDFSLCHSCAWKEKIIPNSQLQNYYNTLCLCYHLLNSILSFMTRVCVNKKSVY